MKKVLLFVIVILLVGVQLFADYSIKNNKVYFKEKIIKGAGAKTFKKINYEYSKDKNNVYYYGEKIDDADYESFETTDSICARDKNGVFYKGARMEKDDTLNSCVKYYQNK